LGDAVIPLSKSDAGNEVTVYVKGFLARGETPERFDHWLSSHEQLCESHGWSSYAVGYPWKSGTLQTFAFPAASVAKTAFDVYRFVRHARSFTPLSFAGWFLAEQVAAISVRFVKQFIEARTQASMRAEDLATQLESLAARHERVRVVAHSLGCRQAIEAAALLPPERRPHEIHLCAPACLEEEVADKLSWLAREATFVYFTDLDLVLDVSFRAISPGRAIGAVGLENCYAGLTAIDVSHAFEFWVHTEYKNRFGRIAHLSSASI